MISGGAMAALRQLGHVRCQAARGRKPPTKAPMSIDLLRQLVRYDAASGEFYWLERPIEFFDAPDDHFLKAAYASWNAQNARKRVRTVCDGKGYQRFQFGPSKLFPKRVLILAHRVAWALTHAEWPAFEIDHIDGNRSNNRLANLRPATPLLNNRNRHAPAKGASGVLGVGWSARNKRWVVDIGGRRVSSFVSLEDATNCRRDAEARLGYGDLSIEALVKVEEVIDGLRKDYRDPLPTHCKHGHEYTPENTRLREGGGRRCLVCLRRTSKAAKARYRARKHIVPGSLGTVPLPLSDGPNLPRVAASNGAPGDHCDSPAAR